MNQPGDATDLHRYPNHFYNPNEISDNHACEATNICTPAESYNNITVGAIAENYREGTLPDLTPKPNPDGTCAAYLVKDGDYCAKIASEHSLTVDKVEGFNKKTWGWTGCNRLQVGVNMCLRYV